MKFVFTLYLFTIIFSTFIFGFHHNSTEIAQNNRTTKGGESLMRRNKIPKKKKKKPAKVEDQDENVDDLELNNSKVKMKGKIVKSDETVLIVETEDDYDSVKVNISKEAENEDDYDSIKEMKKADKNDKNRTSDESNEDDYDSLADEETGELDSNNFTPTPSQNKNVTVINKPIFTNSTEKQKSQSKLTTNPTLPPQNKLKPHSKTLRYKCNLNYVDFDNRPFVDAESCVKGQIYDVLLMLCIDEACIPDITQIKPHLVSPKLLDRIQMINDMKKKKKLR